MNIKNALLLSVLVVERFVAKLNMFIKPDRQGKKRIVKNQNLEGKEYVIGGESILR